MEPISECEEIDILLDFKDTGLIFYMPTCQHNCLTEKILLFRLSCKPLFNSIPFQKAKEKGGKRQRGPINQK